MSFCSNCGNWIYSTDKVCPKCSKDPNKKIAPEEQPEEEAVVEEVSSSDIPSADEVPEVAEVASESLDDEVPEVDEASLEKLDEEIVRIEDTGSKENQEGTFSVCPNCGSPEIGLVPINIDILEVLYKPTKYYCRNCGYEGVPFTLDGPEAVQAFTDSKNKAPSKKVEPQPKPLYGISSSFDKSTSKKPYVAAILSFIWPGVGQVYNGQAGKGLLFFVVAVVTMVFSSQMVVDGNSLGYPLFLVVDAGIVLDAYINATAASEK